MVEAVAVSKFSEYLVETGFYFANINDPNKTIYGQVVPDDMKSEKIADPKDPKSKNKPPKIATADKDVKFATYLQIASSIQ